MKHQKTGDVMTRGVVSVRHGTGFKDITKLLIRNNISGLPVVDDDEKVIGVISETDLMQHQASQGEEHQARRWSSRLHLPVLTAGARERRQKARARTAGQLMSTPPVTVRAGESIASAARTMAAKGIERLPVVDEEDRLVGIVTRRDLLQIFLRPDSEIRQEILDQVVVRTLWLVPQTIQVTVTDGVVTLRGELERTSEIPVAVQLTGQVDGVVAVVNQLTARLDDSHLRPAESGTHGIADDWLRRI